MLLDDGVTNDEHQTCSFSLLQSSGTGKTRLLTEPCENDRCVIYVFLVNCRPDAALRGTNDDFVTRLRCAPISHQTLNRRVNRLEDHEHNRIKLVLVFDEASDLVDQSIVKVYNLSTEDTGTPGIEIASPIQSPISSEEGISFDRIICSEPVQTKRLF